MNYELANNGDQRTATARIVAGPGERGNRELAEETPGRRDRRLVGSMIDRRSTPAIRVAGWTEFNWTQRSLVIDKRFATRTCWPGVPTALTRRNLERGRLIGVKRSGLTSSLVDIMRGHARRMLGTITLVQRSCFNLGTPVNSGNR